MHANCLLGPLPYLARLIFAHGLTISVSVLVLRTNFSVQRLRFVSHPSLPAPTPRSVTITSKNIFFCSQSIQFRSNRMDISLFHLSTSFYAFLASFDCCRAATTSVFNASSHGFIFHFNSAQFSFHFCQLLSHTSWKLNLSANYCFH